MSKQKHRILVTGGAGFIGSHLTDKLLDEGNEVTVIDNLVNGDLSNLEDAGKSSAFRFVKGDILDRYTVKNVMKDVDYVFHLACLGVRHSIHSPFQNHRVNAEGSLVLLEEAKERGVKHFFYISTSEIYGKTSSFPITENAPTNPLTVYGASKLAGEHYSNAFWECYQFPVTVLRIFNNYGPRAHYEGDAGEIIPRSIVKALYNQSPVIFGDGSITRDFFYVKDTASVLNGFLQLALTEKRNDLLGQTFNVGTGEEITMKELISKLLEEMNSSSLGIEYHDNRPADVPRLWVNADKFKKLTGFKPSYTFEGGLGETISYYREKMKQKDLVQDIKLENWKR